MMDSRRWALGRYEQSVKRIASRHDGGVTGLVDSYLAMTLSPAAALDYARIQGLQRASEVMAEAIVGDRGEVAA